MIGYATIGTADMEKAKAFWSGVLASKGASVLMDIGRIAFIGSGMDQPMLAVCIPYNEEAPSPGNGNMLAIPAETREEVDALYAKAMELGASDDGEPGERMPTFYGAYIRDPDGNKACFYKMG
ncbi:MAG: VOC family protein [Pseudomonadales bacterium]|jgi:catechol 2,3-dioxygenase-like lactoylglutathione lyase family enzyme|nr:VOC family protein [Pseudomonadales bacterium]